MINGIGKHVAFGDWFIFRSEVCAPKAPQVVGRVSTSSLFMAGESPSVWTHRAWLTPPPADMWAAHLAAAAHAHGRVFLGTRFPPFRVLTWERGRPGLLVRRRFRWTRRGLTNPLPPAAAAFHGPASSALGLRVLHARAKTYFPLFFFVCFVFHFQPD